MTQTFNELGLTEAALFAVKQLNYETPTPVQERAIPLIGQGRDIIAAAKTGTGKTAAFSLPSMGRLGHVQRGQGPKMLVITPTRELATQIGSVCETIAKSTHHRVASVVGGLAYAPQVNRLKNGVDVLIATPGRLIDLMEQQAVRLNNVEVFVLDEADRMLDMGFWPSVKKIAAAIPPTRQTLLFSATLDQTVKASAGNLLNNPAFVEIAHRGETADTVDQYLIRTEQTSKPDLLKAVLQEKGSERVIVFARTRSRADSCTRRLRRLGLSVEALHSDRSQAQRRRALENFSKGKTAILAATDVLARGIDVSEVSYVINYDLPNQPEDYVHRIGRTGRAGELGFSISFVSPDQEPWLKDIEKLIKKNIPLLELKNYDPAQAEEKAAARAERQVAKRDPELAQAAAEHAKRTTKKQENREVKKTFKKKKPAQAHSRSKELLSVVEPKLTPKLGSAQVSVAKKQKPNPVQLSAGKKQKRPKSLKHAGQYAPSSSFSKDMRPGRAHRAALAKKHSR